MRFEPAATHILLPICAVLGLAGQPAYAATGAVSAQISICGTGRMIDLPLGGGHSDPRRHGDPCGLSCHAGGLSRRRSAG